MQGTGGEVIQFERGSVPAVREDYTNAIQLWCQTRDTAEALTREEIGAMQKFDRVDAQRKSLIINLSIFYRDNPRADVAPGVLTLITFLSDNDKGACQMSQAQMALVLHRTRTTVADAVTRLKASGLMRSVNGKSLAYPTIPRAIAGSYNHLVWITDALKNAPTCLVEPTGSNLSGRADSSNIPVPLKRQVSEPTCRVEGGQPVGSTRQNFTKGNSKEEIILDSARDARSLTKALAIGIAAAAGALPAAAAPIDPPAIIQPAKLSLQDMTDRMMDAAGAALANFANCPGLLVTAELQRWLTHGCDFEGDILPAIRAGAAKMPPGSCRSWSYFTQGVANAKATREAPMPTGNAPPGKVSSGRPLSFAEEEIQRRRKFMDELDKMSKERHPNG